MVSWRDRITGTETASGAKMALTMSAHRKPEYQINVREAVYLDSSLDLF